MSSVRNLSPGEANPFRPNVPESVRDISEDLFHFLQEQASALRETHGVTQAGDSTVPWEHLTWASDTEDFTLGSLGRFVHPDYGIITCRFVQFSDMAAVFPGSPVGIDKRVNNFQWLVTNQLELSDPSLVQGVCGTYGIPAKGQYGWVIVNGVNPQDMGLGGIPSQFLRLKWAATGEVGPSDIDSITIGRIFGRHFDPNGLAWSIPGGSIFIDVLSLQEATNAGIAQETGNVEERLFLLEQAFKGISYNVDVKLNDSDIRVAQANDRVNQTADMISRRVAAVDVEGIRTEITDQLSLAATFANKAGVSADNAAAAQSQSFTNAISSNTSSRTASIRSDEAGFYADSATNSANAAQISSDNANTQAAAAATSASNASVSETNAGTSATAAANSATSAATSAGTATTQAGIATTQAGNASTSAGNAATSASQASTSATNAAGSASTASSSATTATNAATTATTQAGVATTQASNASTSASQASTSATNAGTSATNASNSATAANTSAVNAASSATSAAGSATTATTQAGAAATSASNAATSATAAGSSASSANTSATNAATSATTASTQATNAGTQATNAANSATAASGSAGTATTQAGIATTQAGIATTQASNASTSATNASTSATAAGVSAASASTSQTAAANSATTAQLTANATPPVLAVDSKGTGYRSTSTGVPDSSLPFTPVNNSGYEIQVGTNTNVYTQAAWEAVAGRIYEVAIEYQVSALAGSSPTLALGNQPAGLDSGYANLVGLSNNTIAVTANGIYRVTTKYSDASSSGILAWPAASKLLRFYGWWTTLGGVTAATVGIRGISVVDVTAREAASTSANAAATSASNASTSATNAATSATSSQTSATNANTSASNSAASASTATTQASSATTSATNAGNSATSAGNSATTAGTNATNAANSATNAASSASTATTQASNSSTSATNAATSATSASTSATNASTSAASANTNAILAASAGLGAINSNPVFAKWTGSSSTPPDDWPSVFGASMTITRATGTESPYALQVATSGTADAYLHQYYPAGSGLTNMTQGIYIVEASVELVAGGLTASGIEFSPQTSGGAQLSSYFLKCAVDPDIYGNVIGAGTVGVLYRFRKTIKVTDATIAKGLIVIHTNWSGLGAATAKTLKWHRACIRAATDAEAAVVSSSGVVVDVASRLATASFETVTVAGSATAALRLDSKAIGGSASSSLALEAEEIQLYNNAAGVRALAMKVQNGNVLMTGDLQVGRGVKVGANRIPVALQSFQLTAKDGDAVSFGLDLTNIPILLFNTDRLVAKTASQVYDVRTTSLTSTGFTLYAKVTTASSPTTLTMTGSTDAGAGVTPRYQMQKTNSADSQDGNYTFTVTLSIVFSGQVSWPDDPAQGYGEYDCYIRPASGSWTYAGTIGKTAVHNGNGTFTKSISGVIQFGGTIGLDGSNAEFGIVVTAGTFSSFDSVSWVAATTSGTSSASPGGELVTITVIPQNF